MRKRIIFSIVAKLIIMLILISGSLLYADEIQDPVGGGLGFEPGDIITATDLNNRFDALNSLSDVTGGAMTNDNGKIGIGTASPAELLDVEGLIEAEGFFSKVGEMGGTGSNYVSIGYSLPEYSFSLIMIGTYTTHELWFVYYQTAAYEPIVTLLASKGYNTALLDLEVVQATGDVKFMNDGAGNGYYSVIKLR